MNFLWHKHIETSEERFWRRVNKNTDSGCWEWSGSLTKKGYGFFKVNKENVPTHRFSWALHFGEIPDGLYVCHTCDNRKCCNPERLFLGTQFDNMQDMVRKGRNANVKGDKNPRATLTESNVIEIRNMWDSGSSIKDLSFMFSSPKTTINNIVSGNTWKHLPLCKRKPSNRGSSLSELDVLEMRRLYSFGISSTLIGKMFRLTQQQAWKVVNYWSWKEVA